MTHQGETGWIAAHRGVGHESANEVRGREAKVLTHYAGRRRWSVSVASLIFGLALWEIVWALGLLPPTLLPSIQDVVRAGIDVAVQGFQGVTLGQDVAISLLRVGEGFLLAAVIGVPSGLLIGTSGTMESIVDPYVQFLRPLPPLGYYTLLIVWFGIGELSKIALLFLTAVPIIIVSSAAGVRAIDRDLLLATSSLGLKGRQMFRFVVFPASLPSIFIGLRLALGATFGSLVAAELIASDSGLGWLVLTAGDYIRTNIVLAGVIVIGLIAIALDRLMVVLERRLVPWAGR